MLDDAVKTRIDDEIASESVVLFMKGTPVFPQCGFSATGLHCSQSVYQPSKPLSCIRWDARVLSLAHTGY